MHHLPGLDRLVKYSAVFFATTEMILLVWIRDNLTLNVLMLTWPVG